MSELFELRRLQWILLIALVIAVASGSVDHFMQTNHDRSPYTLISVVLFLLLSAAQGFLLYYVGDAARYLSPSPENIALRQRIRTDGVALLRRLHESGEYDRIVVVGHSLGSVIGYDMLTALWRDYNSVYDFQAKDAELDQLLKRKFNPLLLHHAACFADALDQYLFSGLQWPLRRSCRWSARASVRPGHQRRPGEIRRMASEHAGGAYHILG